MLKFRKSNNVDILKPGEHAFMDLPLMYRQGYYILSHKLTKKEYLINETIKHFIDQFLSAKAIIEVIEEIARQVQTDIKKIENQCFAFFKFLCERKILVPSDIVEVSISHDTLYKAGDCIGDLCILQVIANKPFLDLYIASSKTESDTYVIKFLNRLKIFNERHYEDQLRDLKREYNMLRSLAHTPYVSQVHSFTESSENAFIKLEHIKGDTLFNFLGKKKDLRESECIDMIIAIIRAFTSLHENNIIHGDIHLANILVTENKGIRLIDLGLSLKVNMEKNEVLKYGGAYYYLPPERINDKGISICTKEPDLFSDVFQLGLIIYFVLFRTLPFKGFIWEELAKEIKEGKVSYPPVPCLHESIYHHLVEIMDKCLDKDPHKRYKDAGALLRPLEEVVSLKK